MLRYNSISGTIKTFKMPINHFLVTLIVLTAFSSCSKSGSEDPPPPVVPKQLTINNWSIGAIANQEKYSDVPITPSIRFDFSSAIDKESAIAGIILQSASGVAIPLNITFLPGDSILNISPKNPVESLSLYDIEVTG